MTCKAMRQGDEWVCRACAQRWDVKDELPCKDVKAYHDVYGTVYNGVPNSYRAAKDGE